ncbi:hypothetical protein L6Q21_08310 [Sandaracinobacter sp. RS1-74]|uniref:hypothetical protein n=1 Tax=Sandaracinobacteroides sayramensis TaxID=2913411 RepID=UPI001EDB8CBC|nr:hypothetical protein [Sandaracinobacteroides sayramensis]MCG2840983.1 hypothetical protein [Sandaracinobacteroides sayramensis]
MIATSHILSAILASTALATAGIAVAQTPTVAETPTAIEAKTELLTASAQPTNFDAINKKLESQVKQVRNSEGTSVDKKGMERGMQSRIDMARAICTIRQC